MQRWRSPDGRAAICSVDGYEASIEPAGQPGYWLTRIAGPGGFWRATVFASLEDALRWCERRLRRGAQADQPPAGNYGRQEA